MIKINEIKKIVNDYSDVRIGVLGSHSALEIMDGAGHKMYWNGN